jgi:hypothetical protein
MTQRRKPPVNLSRDQVTIRVYPFGGTDPIPGWIEDGCLDTPAGPPARGVRVELDRDVSTAERAESYLAAYRVLIRQCYRNVWIVMGDGTKVRSDAL